MTRSFVDRSVDQLEDEYDRASSAGDVVTLQKLSHELTHCKTPRARELQLAVDETLSGMTGTTTPGSPPARTYQPTQLTPRRRQRQTNKHRRRTQNPTKHKPTPEQSQAIEAFLSGGSLKINAYAGAGKTSTLEMLAHATALRGQYIAFNRAIVADAKDKFPNTVNCSTTHGLAYRSTSSEYRGSSEKMTGKVNAHKLAELLGLKKNWRIDEKHTLQPVSQAAIILKTLQRYTQSADLEPLPDHVPRHGSLPTASESTIKAVEDFAV